MLLRHWLDPFPGPGADSIGSSHYPGPEPYRPQWLVPLLRARSRVDRLGSSRHPGPEPPGPHWLVPFPGPGAVSVTGHFCAGPLVSVCLALTLRWAETLPLEFGRRLYVGPSLTLRWSAPPGSSRTPGPES